MTRLISVVLTTTVLLVLAAAALTPRPVGAAGPISASISKSGNTVTVAPSGPVAADEWCGYLVNVRWPQFSQVTASYGVRNVAPSSGRCPNWTFSIPNPSPSAGSYDSYQVTIDVQAGNGVSQVWSSPATITVTPSSAHPAASSTLPMVFWTVSPPAPATNATVTATAVASGGPGGFPGACQTYEGQPGYDCLLWNLANGANGAVYTSPLALTQTKFLSLSSWARVSAAHAASGPLFIESGVYLWARP